MLKTMKKEYIKPDMCVVELKLKYSILQASQGSVNSVESGNVFDEIVESDDDYNGVVR